MTLRLPLVLIAVLALAPARAQRVFDAGPYAGTVWTLADGLPQNSVYGLAQSRDGFLWLVTDSGVARFDGDTFESLIGTPPGLALTTAVHEDATGQIWVGTYDRGAGRYVPPSREAPTGRFDLLSEDLPGPHVWAFADGTDGALWIATDAGVAHVREAQVTTFTEAHGLPSAQVRSLLVDRTGGVWAGTTRGLARRSVGARFEAVDLGVELPTVHALAEGPDGTIWIGTSAGLFRLGGESATAVPDVTEPIAAVHVTRDGAVWAGAEAPRVIRLGPDGTRLVLPTGEPGRSGGVRSILDDREGNVWVGTYGYGLVRYRRTIVRHLTEADGLAHNLVRPILQTRSGDVWIGTRGAAVHRLPAGALARGDLRTAPIRLAGAGRAVETMAEGREGTIWVGVSGRGVARVEGTRLTLVAELRGAVDPVAMVEDRGGRLWVGLRGGLWRRDPNGSVRRFTRADGLPEGDVRTLVEDPQGRLWVGMSTGLVLAEADGTPFRRFTRADGLADDEVFAILPDPDVPGALWIGGGARLSHVATEAGDVSITPLATGRMLVHDGRGHLWTRDVHSLRRVALADLRAVLAGEIETVPSTTYGREAGLEGEGVYGFGPPAAATRDGHVLFPTTLGVAVVDLETLGSALPPPPVHITHVEADTSRHAAGAVPARLGPGLDRFVVHFTGLDLTAPERVRYRYRLDGFDSDWVETDERQAVYTNLPPGAYTFRVQAVNHQGTWSPEAATLSVDVRPFFVQTRLFRVLLALGLVGLGLAIVGVRVRGLRRQESVLRERVRQRTEALEREKARTEAALHEARESRATVEAQADQLRELDRAKSRLFANLSHEFRTPLALILGPLEATMDAEPDLQIAHAQATRLLDLVNQLLDLSTLDAGHLRLHREATDLGALAHRVAASFRSAAEAGGLALSVHAEPLVAHVDAGHIERVLTNLLANALAHTEAGGKVAVSVASRAEGDAAPEAVLAVRDTGSGIPADALPHLFDRFFQVERTARGGQAGTGIGLALAKELVERHGGAISVESQEGFGSTFTVRLPLAVDAELPPATADAPRLGAEMETTETASDRPLEGTPQIVLQPVTPTAHRLGAETEETATEAAQTATEAEAASRDASSRTDRPTLLLVEDHADLRGFLARALADAYTVHPAADGAEGLDLARQIRPDLVVSDVMMPEMDGLALTAALRDDDALRETPVLLLTARADAEGEIAGLEAGADDYLAKPFSVPVLRARLGALLERRRDLRERYAQHVSVGPSEILVTSDEAAFVERVREAAEAALSDPDLTVEALAARVAVSPRQLSRRVKALTGLSPAAFVRAMRMERARHLLAGRTGTVAEVAYAVGFRSVSHFTKRFKAEFGVPPSEWAAREPATET